MHLAPADAPDATYLTNVLTPRPLDRRFFYRNKHIMIDLGTGNNNKINWAIEDKQEFIDIVETVYRGASKGRGLVVSPKGEQRTGLIISWRQLN